MARLVCRVLPFALADGPHNMAADEALLAAAGAGRLSLRFYGWTPPTVSLGYFQPSSLCRDDPALAALPCVRRPSGGMTLVHHHELTYALALPPALAGGPTQRRLVAVHWVLSTVLAAHGLPVRLHEPEGEPQSPSPLCFHHFSDGDLVLGGAKVVGSAQRKVRGALLQHGGILLARSPHTPSLPGIRELTGVLLDPEPLARKLTAALAGAFDWDLDKTAWSPEEQWAIEAVARDKFSSPQWNDRR